jgi:glycosyltransferase involved in cell wall biosynthesis
MTQTFSVALGTYNGEKYLQEQLDSIATQTHLPAELVVGDDGSTDKTMEILERFAASAPFPVHIVQNTENLGYGENFLQIASRCASDWIAFCDQDDIWMENKLAKVARIIDKNKDVGVVVHELTAVDEDLHPFSTYAMRIRFSRKVGVTKGYYRVYLGLAIVFNRSLMNIVDWQKRPIHPAIGTKWTHDGWLSVLSYAVTQRYLTTEPLGLYRRHGGNVSHFDNPGLASKLARVSTTASEIYLLESEITSRLSDWFGDYAQNMNATDAAPILQASAAFRQVSNIYLLRKNMYDATRFGQRLALASRLFMTRGYLGHFRPNDYVKDFIRAFVGG